MDDRARLSKGRRGTGSYWVVQQQRLAMIDSVTPWQALLLFIFLFLIVLLPISTGLWGRSGTTPAMVMIYGTHLALIASLNLMLWINVHRSVAAHAQIVRSSLALALLPWRSGQRDPISPRICGLRSSQYRCSAATSRSDCMGRDAHIVAAVAETWFGIYLLAGRGCACRCSRHSSVCDVYQFVRHKFDLHSHPT
jgi:hypothetical protein